ncbi:MAG: radical SAM protein [Nanoarchaeota archaeon]|nr:radical SAM protein [Nanoarchaeota archaeon]
MAQSSVYSDTMSVCPVCDRRIAAKIVFKGSVFMKKACKEHGEFETILEEDIEFYKSKASYAKPGTESIVETETKKGCPFDCGLCPEHDQHTCIGLIEVTSICDLKCNVCYARSGKGTHLSMVEIEKRMDHFQKAEHGKAEILQISGGEPTTHPQIIEILELAKKKGIKHVMLNTNGVRIAHDPDFAEKLSKLMPGFEIYLSFDGLSKEAYSRLRGTDLLQTKLDAVKNLTDHKIPITLVVTLDRASNLQEVGRLINFGLATECIRGINFQPVAYFGRISKVEGRITVSGVIAEIDRQTSGMIKKTDFVPLPCSPDSTALTFLYRNKDGFIPVTRETDIRKYLDLIDNTFAFYGTDTLPKAVKACCTGNVCGCMDFLKGVSKVAPIRYALKSKKKRKEYIDNDTFRISITSFIDKYNLDIRTIKKECVHMIEGDKRIPFSTYNMFYRKVPDA